MVQARGVGRTWVDVSGGGRTVARYWLRIDRVGGRCREVEVELGMVGRFVWHSGVLSETVLVML